MKIRIILFFFIIIGSLHTNAFMLIRSNFLMSATHYSLALRSNTALLFGTSSFSVGFFGQYEAPHAYVRDDMYGLSLRAGSNWFVEAGGGPYRKFYDGVGGSGYGGYFLFGKQLGRLVQVSILTVSKDISSGSLERRSIIEFYPSIGITWEI